MPNEGSHLALTPDAAKRGTQCACCCAWATRPERTGEHRYLCGGRVVTGPPADAAAQCACLGGFSVVLAGWVPVATLVVAPHTNPLLVLGPSLAYALALACFVGAALTDPGLVVRRSPDAPPPTAAERADPRFCATCGHVREARTFHCATCDACTRETDHHCGVIGQCVGARNKLPFLVLLVGIHLFFVAGFASTALGAVGLGSSAARASPAFAAVAWAVGALETLLVLVVGAGAAVVGLGLDLACPPLACVPRLANRCLYGSHLAPRIKDRSLVVTLLAREPACGGACSVPESLVFASARAGSSAPHRAEASGDSGTALRVEEKDVEMVAG